MKNNLKTRKEKRDEERAKLQALPKTTRIIFYFSLFFTTFTLINHLNSYLFKSFQPWPLWLTVITSMIVSIIIFLIENSKKKI
jgi:hypothetical protein